MKAAVMHEFGDVDVLHYEEIRTPSPKAGHVLIKVLAAGVNRFDHYIREGSVTQDIPLPHILGTDAAGEVSDIGEGVIGFAVGDKVVAVPGFPLKEEDYDIRPSGLAPSFTLPGLGIWGAYAQYIELPARFVLKDSTGLSPEYLASLPMALATSVRAVKVVGEVKAGDKVLIQSGSSGSGSMQIQVAKALGAEVATTIRNESKAETVKSLGADLIINTRNEDFVAATQKWTDGRGADVVIDNLGGDVLARSIDAVKGQGLVVAYGFTAGTEVTFDIRNFFFGQKRLVGTMASDVEDFQWGLDLVKKGVIKPLLDRTLPLSEAAQAHRLIADNQVAGNIVLMPWAA